MRLRLVWRSVLYAALALLAVVSAVSSQSTGSITPTSSSAAPGTRLAAPAPARTAERPPIAIPVLKPQLIEQPPITTTYFEPTAVGALYKYVPEGATLGLDAPVYGLPVPRGTYNALCHWGRVPFAGTIAHAGTPSDARGVSAMGFLYTRGAEEKDADCDLVLQPSFRTKTGERLPDVATRAMRRVRVRPRPRTTIEDTWKLRSFLGVSDGIMSTESRGACGFTSSGNVDSPSGFYKAPGDKLGIRLSSGAVSDCVYRILPPNPSVTSGVLGVATTVRATWRVERTGSACCVSTVDGQSCPYKTPDLVGLKRDFWEDPILVGTTSERWFVERWFSSRAGIIIAKKTDDLPHGFWWPQYTRLSCSTKLGGFPPRPTDEVRVILDKVVFLGSRLPTF